MSKLTLILLVFATGLPLGIMLAADMPHNIVTVLLTSFASMAYTSVFVVYAWTNHDRGNDEQA